MQWGEGKNAGFGEGKTSLLVNPNYLEGNVTKDLSKHYSIIRFYQALIALRKKHDVLINGLYDDMNVDSDEYYLYQRFNQKEAIFVVGNFTDHNLKIKLPFKDGQLILNNLDEDQDFFLPYQVKVYYVKKE